jgi:signal transduction histidine kinase
MMPARLGHELRTPLTAILGFVELLEVLVNLLSNAVKYNRPDGIVHVSVERGDAVCVAVRDTGRGIAADDLPRLYRPFERLGAAGSDIPGTGLGLAISKHLADVLGGSIACDSQPGVGSTFTLRLPLRGA